MKNKPEPTLTLLALVTAAYDKPLCCEVCVRIAKEQANQVLLWTAYQVAELISTANLKTALLTHAGEGYPDVLHDCMRCGYMVILRLNPDRYHDTYWYGILYECEPDSQKVLALASEPDTLIYETPLSLHATGEYVIVLDRGDLERGMAALATHGILVT